jgi:hypothetical protein
VAGTATVVDGEKTISLLTSKVTGTGSVEPLGMTNRALGGGNWLYTESTGAGQRGIAEAFGLNNIGLLVRIWGRVTELETVTPPAVPSWFKLDDGSGVNVKVTVPSGVTVPAKNSYAWVTGISSCEKPASDLLRLLRVRQQTDIGP